MWQRAVSSAWCCGTGTGSVTLDDDSVHSVVRHLEHATSVYRAELEPLLSDYDTPGSFQNGPYGSATDGIHVGSAHSS